MLKLKTVLKRPGHPWVYSNELVSMPQFQGFCPLYDTKDRFVAHGWMNYRALIAFRIGSRDPQDIDHDALVRRSLERAIALRAGMQGSYRLVFGESDRLPGLVIDRYSYENSVVHVVQLHTYASELMLPIVREVLGEPMIVRRDIGVRELEGMAKKETEVFGELPKGPFFVMHDERELMAFESDLVSGQKTGFFLDQAAAIAQFGRLARKLPFEHVRVLDLCTHVGQWSAHLAKFLDRSITCIAVDSSASALEYAALNIERQLAPLRERGHQAELQCIQHDVMRLDELKIPPCDIVIIDPPSFIKSKKNIVTGLKGYEKVNALAVKKLSPQGLFATCSCSRHVSGDEFYALLGRAALPIAWIGQSMQARDHFVLSSFPESRYLKVAFGVRCDS